MTRLSKFLNWPAIDWVGGEEVFVAWCTRSWHGLGALRQLLPARDPAQSRVSWHLPPVRSRVVAYVLFWCVALAAVAWQVARRSISLSAALQSLWLRMRTGCVAAWSRFVAEIDALPVSEARSALRYLGARAFAVPVDERQRYGLVFAPVLLFAMALFVGQAVRFEHGPSVAYYTPPPPLMSPREAQLFAISRHRQAPLAAVMGDRDRVAVLQAPTVARTSATAGEPVPAQVLARAAIADNGMTLAAFDQMAGVDRGSGSVLVGAVAAGPSTLRSAGHPAHGLIARPMRRWSVASLEPPTLPKALPHQSVEVAAFTPAGRRITAARSLGFSLHDAPLPQSLRLALLRTEPIVPPKCLREPDLRLARHGSGDMHGRDFPVGSSSFGVHLAAAARAQTSGFVVYNDSYQSISFPNGDVPLVFGVCTDVVVRAYRAMGIDLQVLVQKSGLGTGDRNIDHRRTSVLSKFFARHAEVLPVSDFAEDYQPGDIVTYYRPQNRGARRHIAIVSDRIGPSGRPMIVHNRGWGPQLEDALFVDRVTGHYRFRGIQDEPSVSRQLQAAQAATE